eukprot:COSAG04_NODE_1730_length_5772_cov_79.772078_2_plen_272_part_00
MPRPLTPRPCVCSRSCGTTAACTRSRASSSTIPSAPSSPRAPPGCETHLPSILSISCMKMPRATLFLCTRANEEKRRCLVVFLLAMFFLAAAGPLDVLFVPLASPFPLDTHPPLRIHDHEAALCKTLSTCPPATLRVTLERKRRCIVVFLLLRCIASVVFGCFSLLPALIISLCALFLIISLYSLNTVKSACFAQMTMGRYQARNPIPRIHTDNIGMAFVGKCLDQRPNKDGPPGALPASGGGGALGAAAAVAWLVDSCFLRNFCAASSVG